MRDFFVVLGIFSCSLVFGQDSDHGSDSFVNTSSKITFNSSDNALKEVFDWAKKQALAYAFEGDAVGLWYEAALPGREVFCMRDVSHQALGAHYLGLAAHTKNMLRAFAENVSDSRDWCSLWEINRHGTPALQDYLNDEEFWYNLPANFDILNCCFRMYNLTGDQAYLNDPVFLNFYQRTVYDYVDRWDIGIDKVMQRDRFMNNSPQNSRKFKNNRGIPGYDEGDADYVANLDLLANQQVAFASYANIQVIRRDDAEAETFFKKADEVRNFINTVWWDKNTQQYFTHLDKNHALKKDGNGSGIPSILYTSAAKDNVKHKKTLEALINKLPKAPSSGIEVLSHLPETLYRYEEPERARQMLLFVFRSERREYPEAPFGAIGAMVEGLMGVELGPYASRSTIKTGQFSEQNFITKSRLTDATEWAEMNHIPLKRNDISVRHEGSTKTEFTNNSGPQLQWKACFAGAYKTLHVNGKPVESVIEILPINGNKISWVNVVVGAGEVMRVEAIR
ncbi:MAG: hypothetical protein GY931_17050 [Maribacter sp.]|nr:hypothetical protein [Maribacter sp.]